MQNTTGTGWRRTPLAALSAVLAAVPAWAAPQVAVDGVTQDSDTGIVSVTYTLSDGPAIITADILSGGASIGTNTLAFCEGDVMQMATNGTHVFTWDPAKAWPGHAGETASLTFAVTAWATNTPPDVVVSDLRNAALRWYPGLDALPDGVTADRYKTYEMVLRKIPGTAAGVWTMGSSHSGHTTKTLGNWAVETAHSVLFTNDWYIGVYPLTQGQYLRVTGAYPDSFFTNALARAKRPVETISYNTFRGLTWPANLYEGAGGKIPTFRAKTGLYVDLPTEAQWEFSCRAGTTTLYWTGSSLTGARTRDRGGLPSSAYPENLEGYVSGDSTAWHNWTYGNGAPEVGSYAPNGYGLYDMHGGVFEWCLDWVAKETVYWEATCVYTNPVGAASRLDSYANCAVATRGGSWKTVDNEARSSGRRLQSYNGSSEGVFGFRLAIPNIPPVTVTDTKSRTASVTVPDEPSTASGALASLEARTTSVADGDDVAFTTAPAGTILLFR